MDVRMPDGTLIKGVPDDITQEDLLAQYTSYTAPAKEQPKPAATATPTATPVAKETSIKAPLVEAKASPSVMPFAVTNKEMAEKFGTSDQRSPVERLIAQQEGKAPTSSPYKTEGVFERAGLTADPQEQLVRSIANEDQFTNPAVRAAARKNAETNIAFASNKAKQAMRSGATKEQADEIFKANVGKVEGVSVAPESYEYAKEYAFKPDATVAGDLGNLARRAGAKGFTGLEQGAGGIYKFVADMADIDAPGIDAQLERLRSKQEGLSASELHGSLIKDTASIFENAGASIIQQLPALGGAFVLKSGQQAYALSNMFVNSFGQTYDDSRKQGLDVADSTIRGGLYGSFEALGEMAGLGHLLKGIKGVADTLPTSQVKQFFIESLKKEIPGELGTYTGQFATDKGFGLNKEAGLNEYFDGAVQTVLATLAQGGMMTGAGVAASYVGNKFSDANKASNRADLAREDALAKWEEEGIRRRRSINLPTISAEGAAADQGRLFTQPGGTPTAAPRQPAAQQPVVPGQPAAQQQQQQPTQTHAQAVQQLALTTRISELEGMGVPPDDAKDIATKEQNEKLGGSLEADSRYTDNRPAVLSLPVSNVPGGNAAGPDVTTTTGLEGTTLPATNVGAGEGTESGALTIPATITTWDRQNRTGRNDEWFAGAAEANPAFEAVNGDFVPAHGMAKAATLTQAYRDLINLLQNGIDPNRTLYTAGLTARPGAGAGMGTAGGYAYREGPFIITFREGTEGQPTTDDITGILVNPANAELVPELQQMFPNLVVRDYNNVADVVEASKTQTKDAAPETNAAIQNLLGLQTPETTQTQEPIQQDENTQQARQVAGQLRRLDPTNPLLERLRSPNVMPDEIAQAQEIVNTLAPTKTAPIEEEGIENPATADEVNQILQGIYTPAQLKANPPVVVNSINELPENIREAARGLKAFVDPDTGIDYYIANNIPKDDVRGSIFHERGGHIGLTNLIGAFRVKVLANQIKTWANTPNDTLEHTIATDAIAAADASGEEQGSDRHNQEVISYFTEIATNEYGIDPLKSQPKEKRKVAEWLRSLWKNIANAIKKINIDPSTLTSEDIVRLVQGASRVGTSRLEKAEAKSVFTPEVLQEIYLAMGNSIVVANEIGEAPVSLEDGSNKLQGSAKNLFNIVSKDEKYNNPIAKIFVNTFYEDIKAVGLGINTKAFETFAVVASVGEYFKPAKAKITEERIQRTLLPVPTLQAALNLDYYVRQIWSNPALAAERESRQVNELREKLAAEAYEMAYENYFAEKEQSDNPEGYKQVAILFKYALNKYTMAGDKLITMSSDNEYQPISFGRKMFSRGIEDSEKKAIRLFVNEFGRSLFHGSSIKQAFSEAYINVILAPRTAEIEKQLGPTKTGWMSFSDPGDAKVVKLVTSDVGRTAKSPWCLAVQTSFGESYLSRCNYWVYLKDANSLISVLCDKQTLQPTTKEPAWFGLGEGQSILPEHEYIKNTLPSLTAPINGAETTNAPLAQDPIHTKVERIFKQVFAGDKGAIKSLLSYDLYKSNEEIAEILSAPGNSIFKTTRSVLKGFDRYDFNVPLLNVLNVSKSLAAKLHKIKKNLYEISVQDKYSDFYIAALFPELNKLADEKGNIAFNPERTFVYNVDETIPKDVFKDAEELFNRYGIKTNIYELISPYYQKGDVSTSRVRDISEIKDYIYEVGHEIYKILDTQTTNNNASQEDIDRGAHGLVSDAIKPINDWVSSNTSYMYDKTKVNPTINIYDLAESYLKITINNKFNTNIEFKSLLADLYATHNLGESPLETKYLDDYKAEKISSILPKMVDASTEAFAKAIEEENKPKLLGSKAKLPSNKKNLWATAKAEMYHAIKAGTIGMPAAIAQAKQALGANANQLTQSHYELAFQAATIQLKKEAAIAKRKAPKPYVDPNAVKIGLAQNFDYIPEDLAEVAEDLAIRPAEVKSNPLVNVTKAVASAANKKAKTLTASGVSTNYIIEKLINAYKIPYIDQLNTTANDMNVMYSKLMSAVSKLQDEWEGFADKDAEANHLQNIVQLYSTLEDIDPTTFTTLQDALTDDPELIRLRSEQTNAPTMQKKHALTKPIQRRTDAIKKFFAAWSKLSSIGNGEGVQIFIKTRNFYKTMNMLHRKLLSDLIEQSDLEGEINDATTPKGKLFAAINAQFVEKGINNYFPLGRYGDYWLSFGKGKNKESYRFESLTARELFKLERIEQLQAAGDTRTWGQRITDGDADIGDDMPALQKNLSSDETDMLRKVLGIIDSQSKDTLTKESLKDAVYQLFLETAPEQSFRKHWMHRKEITGFTTDMKRHFINTGVSLASQLSRLKYGAQINLLMENAEEYLKGNPVKEEVTPYMNELKWRIHQLVNPQAVNTYVGPLVNGITQGVFMWTLSSPVTALVDLTALPIFGYSTLARHFGVVDATAAMTKQLNLIKYFTIAAKNSNGKYIPISLGLAPHVKNNPILTAAYNEFVRTELLEKTSSHELLGMAKLPSSPKWKVPYVPSVRNTMYVTANVLGFFFHQTGRLNREMMALTAFELAYKKAVKKGMAPGTNGEAYNHALRIAVTLTNKAMFDYTAFNRPGILRPLPMRVFFQLKSFLIFSVEYAVEGACTVLRTTNNTPEQRAGAIKQILISTFMMLMFAGASGLIGIDDLWGVIQLIYESMHPEGKKQKFNRRDIKLWFEYSVLPNAVGADMAELILKGPVSYYSGIDFASRISLGSVIFPQRQAYDGWLDSFKHLGTSFPALSVLSNFIRAGQEFKQGHIYQAWEHLTPNLIKNPIQAKRWAEEGVRNQYDRGIIYNKKMLTQWDLMWKALGANPLPVAEQREKNFALKSALNKITDRRRALLDKFAVEVQNRRPAEVKQVFKDIAKFNRDNPQPEFIIDADTLQTSINTKLLNSAKEYRGLKIPDTLRGQAVKLNSAGKKEKPE